MVDFEKIQTNLKRLQKELSDADAALAERLHGVAGNVDRDRATYAQQIEALDQEEQQELQRHTDAMIELRRRRDVYTDEFNRSLIDATARLREIVSQPPASQAAGFITSQAAE